MVDPCWTCAGCGKPSPGRVRVCDCPTGVVCSKFFRKNAWKVEPEGAEIAAREDKAFALGVRAALQRLDRHIENTPEAARACADCDAMIAARAR